MRVNGSVAGKDIPIQYIHVDERDMSGPFPVKVGVSTLPDAKNWYVSHSEMIYPHSADSGYSGSYRTPSSEERSLERSESSKSSSESNSKRNSKISENESNIISSSDSSIKDINAHNPSHSINSCLVASPDNCDETNFLLYDKYDGEIGQGDGRIEILPKLSHDKSASERKRHNSKSLRIRHASYEGPASPRLLEREEQLELGHFAKVVEDTDSSSNDSRDSKDDNLCGSLLSAFGLVVLLFANLLNYMDRYTIAGVLPEVQAYYDISDSQAGLLQTSFIIFYMLFSPLFGYLGDRYNRKWLMAVGIFLWSLITFIGSFVPQDYFWGFVVMRGMVGIGEASYSTIAPTIIADMFSKDSRTKALAVFYFAIPVGSGLGYIVGSKVAEALGAWQWALRVTPPLGIVCVLLIIFVVREPARGASDGAHDLHTSTSLSSWGNDIKQLCQNKSFVYSTLGFTCVAFVAGALAFWAPTYINHSIAAQGKEPETDQIALMFGVITCVAGVVGVAVGSETARRLRPYYKNADPLVCAFGLIMCAPFLFLALIVSRYNTYVTWALILVGETFLCLNWAIVTDILLYTVVPNVRSTAEAIQILVSHALGDAGSPYLVGVISDAIKRNSEHGNDVTEYISLQYALYCTAFACVLGGGFFLATSLYVVRDRANAEKACKTIEITATVDPAEENGVVPPAAHDDYFTENAIA